MHIFYSQPVQVSEYAENTLPTVENATEDLVEPLEESSDDSFLPYPLANAMPMPLLEILTLADPDPVQEAILPLADLPASPDLPDPAWLPLIRRLAADGFDANTMADLFTRLGSGSYTPAYMGAKITELYGTPGIGINRDKVPSPKIPPGYTPPVSDISVGSCLAFLKEYESVLTDIRVKHGVSAPVILAVLLIETGLGQDLGKDLAFRALASMAATTSSELLASRGNSRQRAGVRASSLTATLRDKSNWAYNELKALIRYADKLSIDPITIPGSIYGAIGICQFMPSNIELFGVDGDKDGMINLFCLIDAMYSVAGYLDANGWRGAATDAQKHRVIRTYNHDDMYAAAVLASSKRLDNALQGKGKISLQSNALIGGHGRVPSARLDPSLRRLRHVPRAARVQSLEEYKSILQ